MTNEELEKIDQVARDIKTIHGLKKDPQAEMHIQQVIANQEDAIYRLVQLCVLSNAAFDNMEKRINEMKKGNVE